MVRARKRASRNRTITLTLDEQDAYKTRLTKFPDLSEEIDLNDMLNTTINQDMQEVIKWVPKESIDLLFLDPPYNMNKDFKGYKFSERPISEYKSWVFSWLKDLKPLLKPTASVYICGEWKTSAAMYEVIDELFIIRNRITWEREKGRGSKTNWKNSSEDIWFCTMSNDYTFNVEEVKLKKKVIAPYKDSNGVPKDWNKTDGGFFRYTYPSNLWTHITVPFWSMQENTDHPTQKPEKLLAKIILASSNPGDVVMDPFLGSGTTSVVCKKLGRNYIGMELNEKHCCIAEKRLYLAAKDKEIQGYCGKAFLERNVKPSNKC